MWTRRVKDRRCLWTRPWTVTTRKWQRDWSTQKISWLTCSIIISNSTRSAEDNHLDKPWTIWVLSRPRVLQEPPGSKYCSWTRTQAEEQSVQVAQTPQTPTVSILMVCSFLQELIQLPAVVVWPRRLMAVSHLVQLASMPWTRNGPSCQHAYE